MANRAASPARFISMLEVWLRLRFLYYSTVQVLSNYYFHSNNL
jgi:hypothetical protein